MDWLLIATSIAFFGLCGVCAFVLNASRFREDHAEPLSPGADAKQTYTIH